MLKIFNLNTWLTQKAMARILGVSQQDISVHARTILAGNKDYEKVFVKKMRPTINGKQMSRRKYYHQVLLEMIARKVRTESSRRFVDELKRAKRRPSLELALITE